MGRIGRRPDKEKVIDALRKAPNLGLPSKQIKSTCRLADDRFNIVRNQLLEDGLVSKYKCQGGGLRLLDGGHNKPSDEAATNKLVEEAARGYKNQRNRYKQLADLVQAKCKELVRIDSIRATIQSRTKDPERYEAKVRQYLKKASKEEPLDTVDKILARSGDLAGVRVTTYVEEDRKRVVEGIRRAFSGPAEGNAVKVDVMDKIAKNHFYRATHCQVTIKDPELNGIDENLKGVGCEIQVCSLLAHVFNEIEHDITYKQMNGDATKVEEGILDALGQLTLAGDQVIVTLLEAVASRQKDREEPFDGPDELVYKVKDKFPDAREFARYSGQLHEDLRKLGLDNEASITSRLLTGDYRERSLQSIKKLNRQFGALELDSQTSDRLLVLLLEHFSKQVIDNHSGRPGACPRIVAIARAFESLRGGHRSQARGRASS